MRLIEFLLISAKDEFLPTITAYQSFVCQSHYCTSFFAIVFPLVLDTVSWLRKTLWITLQGSPHTGGKLRNDTKQGINYSPNYTPSGIQKSSQFTAVATYAIIGYLQYS
jgi:hypothetical protein